MSDNKAQEASYVGTPVRIPETTQGELGITLDEAIIAAVFATDTGIKIHLVNPEDGGVTPAFGLEHIEFLPETVSGLKALHKMQQEAIKQIVAMFEDDE